MEHPVNFVNINKSHFISVANVGYNAGLAHNMWSQWLILISKFHAKIGAIVIFNKISDRYPLFFKGVFATNVAKLIRLEKLL